MNRLVVSNMKSLSRVGVGACVLLLVTACAAPSGRAPVDERSTNVEEQKPRETEAVAKPLVQSTSAEAQPLPEQPEVAAQEVNPAVVALLNTAQQQEQVGDHERAAASLERALDIEPENAWLWHRLARVRLQQGRLDQAASLAAKSNTLAGSDPRLSAENWGLIASVRQQQGDLAGAREASERARTLGGTSN